MILYCEPNYHPTCKYKICTAPKCTKNISMQFRYSMLKYEDLMTSPMSTLFDLYSRLNLNFDVIAADALYNHTRSTKKGVNSLYYSTLRTADTDIFKQKKELPLNKILHVEKNCNEFMQKIGYKVFQSKSKKDILPISNHQLRQGSFRANMNQKKKLVIPKPSLKKTTRMKSVVQSNQHVNRVGPKFGTVS